MGMLWQNRTPCCVHMPWQVSIKSVGDMALTSSLYSVQREQEIVKKPVINDNRNMVWYNTRNSNRCLIFVSGSEAYTCPASIIITYVTCEEQWTVQLHDTWHAKNNKKGTARNIQVKAFYI
jgi:hypothetical protein